MAYIREAIMDIFKKKKQKDILDPDHHAAGEGGILYDAYGAGSKKKREAAQAARNAATSKKP